MVGAQRLNNAW
jgi:hypothetical protein